MTLLNRLRLTSPPYVLLCGILLVAAALRLYSISHGVTFHPDERHIVMVTERLSLEDPNPHSFAYGSFPFYFSWIVSETLGFLWPSLTRYDGLFLVGRCVAALFGIVGVLLTYILAQIVFNRRSVSLLAASFTALNVFHLQLSRFFAVDIFLTTWCLVALIAAARLAQSGGWKNYALAGLSFGFALATKISAVTLLAPFGIAVLAQARRESKYLSPKQIVFGLAALIFAILVCLALQPYAILDWETFLKHTKEQTDMVQGRWRPPYTIQYEGTAPYWYPLSQMWSYTMGPPLALAALAGLIFVALKQFRGIRYGELVLLAWIVPAFLAFAGLPVKFPRYFLPIYPALFVLAAFALIELSRVIAQSWLRRLRAVPVIIVLGWTGFYALSFVRIYSVDHAYQLATRWIFQNIPPGSGILGVDWDDKLPLFLPGLDPRQYRAEGRTWELPLYAKDSNEKLSEMVEKLGRADYIIFPTPRTYGSIPRIPHEYVMTTNFLRLLFAGKLGYALEQTVKVRPKLGNITFDDDTADESFWVYDHPKVSIFKKTETLPASELKRRILEAHQFAPLPTMEQMMRMNAGSPILPPSSMLAGLGTLVLWFLVLEILGLIALPFVASILPRAPDAGHGIAKVCGLLLLGSLLWILTSLGIAKTNVFFAWSMLLILGGAAYVVARRINLVSIVRDRSKSIIVAELLFLAGFIGFAGLRAFQPEIFWGEKPMDFTFLNYFIRLDTLPPQDPWAAGHLMHYYYFGSYLFGIIHKLGAFDSAVGYNLSIASVAAYALSSAYSLCLLLTRHWAPALFGALAVITFSNLEVLRLIFWGDKRSFDLFWASTRLFKEPGITEYPLWALLFADLHAHLIALPFALVLLALALRFLSQEREALGPSLLSHRLVCGLLLGCLFITNTWDFISYGFTLGCIIAAGSLLVLGSRKASFLSRLATVATDLGRDIPLLILGALPILLLFNRSSGSQISPSFGFNQSFEFNSIDQVLRHLGHWLVIVTAGLAALSLTYRACPRRSLLGRMIFAILIALIPAGFGLITLLRPFGLPAPELHQLPWDILGLCSGLAFLAAFTMSGRRCPRQFRTAAIFAIAAACIIAGAEICFLMDHMNTIFKFYNAVWVLLALAAVLVLPRTLVILWSRLPRTWAWFVGRPASLALTALLAIACAGSLFNIYTMTTFQRIMGPRPTLDGMAYLYWQDPHEAAALHWIRKNIKGSPVILEAQGPSYQAYTRVSMHTGLPTVLGWEWHVQQRGTPAQAVRERADVIKAIYSAPDPESAIDYLKLLGVDLVYIGPLERQLYALGTYNRAGLKKWDEHYTLFQPVFRSGTTVVYKLPFSTLP